MLSLENLEELEIHDLMFDTEDELSFVVSTTDTLIAEVNQARQAKGYTDLVGADYENDVYYSFYLTVNMKSQKIELFASVAHGEKDDYAEYNIELPKNNEVLLFLLWKVLADIVREAED